MDDRYFFRNAPQWTNFDELDSENDQHSTYFDQSHEELESTFFSNINNMEMSPLKLKTPMKKKENSSVLKEFNVNEVLTSAMEGMKIVSSMTKKRPTPAKLNATINSVENSQRSSRLTRISRSMYSKSTPQKIPATTNSRASMQKIKITPSANAIETKQDPTRKTITAKRRGRSGGLVDEESKENIVAIPCPLKVLSTPKFKNPTIVKSEKPITKTPNVEKTPRILLTRCDETVDRLKLIKKEEVASKADNVNLTEDVEAAHSSEEHTQMQWQEEDLFVVHVARHAVKPQIRKKEPSVLTNPARRRSIVNKHRARLEKYVSLAEGVSSFQRKTPTRFRSVPVKPNSAQGKPAVPKKTVPVSPALRCKARATRHKEISSAPPASSTLPSVKPIAAIQGTTKTVPISPALQCKNRRRRNQVLSQAEREELELKELRKNQVHARPVPINILKAPVPLKPVPMKPVTIPQPFQLTEIRNAAKETSETSQKFTRSTSARRRTTVLIPTDDHKFERAEIENFGIPITPNTFNSQGARKKKVTRPEPFGMENRRQELLQKQQLKLLQGEEDNNKNKTAFRARPVPTTVKNSRAAEGSKVKPIKSAPLPQKVIPFSFETRDKNISKKKDELRKKIEEEEKKAREFHANPAPNFKPVLVRTQSKKSLIAEKSKEFLTVPTLTRRAPNSEPRATVRGRSADSRLTSKKNSRSVSAGRKIKSRVQSAENLSAPTSGKHNAQHTDSTKLNVPGESASNMPALKPRLRTLPIKLRHKEMDKLVAQKLTKK